MKRDRAHKSGKAPAHSRAAESLHSIGLSREEIDAALDELPRTPQSIWSASAASLSGIGKQDLEADLDY